eukprot:Sspe_Gene.92838::Locus_65602_Transcript_1_1_Confidence_1.000_Length_1037::g.92838::m.92838
MPSIDTCLARCCDFSELLDLANPSNRTKFGKGRNLEGGLRIHTKEAPGSSIQLLLGVLQMDATVEEFQACLKFECRKEWDELFLEGRDIKVYHPKDFHGVEVFHRYMAFRSPTILVSHRDFEVLVSERVLDDGRFVCKAVSITPGVVPTPRGFVRGEVLTSGFIAVPIKGGGIEVTYIAQMDPKGWIPPQVVNLIAARQSVGIQQLRKYLKKRFRRSEVTADDLLAKL